MSSPPPSKEVTANNSFRGARRLGGTGEFADEVMRWVAQKVSDHKRLRRGVVLIRAIPKSPSGKILRKELRALAKTEREDAVKSTRPAKL